MHYDEAIQHCIFQFTSGSHQYGTSRPDSDVDKRGVFVAPLASAFNIFQTGFVGSGTIRQEVQSAIECLMSADPINAKHHLEEVLATDRGDLTLSVET